MSGQIKKKQVLGLLKDLAILQYGMPILKRDTLFSGEPGQGEAILNTDSSAEITTVTIHTTDSFLGNSYSQLIDVSIDDKLIIKDEDDNVAIYSITNITNEVNSSNEGYFILTTQHSFGYNSTFPQGELIYYFRRVPSSSITESISTEAARVTSIESELKSDLDNEVAARIATDTSLQAADTAETNARIAADVNLETLIDNETTSRNADVANLQAADTAETNARIIADNNLESLIDNETTTRISQNSQLLAITQAETDARIEAINSISLQLENGSGVISSGEFSWDGQNTGLALQAGEFSWSGEEVYDGITSLTFHKTDGNGTDQSTFLNQYLNAKSGQIRTILSDNPNHDNVYQIVGASINGDGHYVFNVYNVSIDDPEVVSGECTVYFVLVGAEGKQGADGTSANYTTSFNGPHSLGDNRNLEADLGVVTVDTGLSYQGGEYVIVSMDARPDSFDIAQVTSYDSSTGVMHFNNIYQSTVDSDSTNWNINLTGVPGQQGKDGSSISLWEEGQTEENRLFLDAANNRLKIIIEGVTYRVDLTAEE